MILKTIFTILVSCFLFAIPRLSLPQDRPSQAQGYTVLDRTRPPQFITYEGTFESRIQLRLRNNTSCPIIIETDDAPNARLTRLSEGKVAIETVTGSRDGLRLRVHYFIQNRYRQEGLRRGYPWGDSVFDYEIPADHSVTFQVPATQLKRRSDIAVPFAYAWEASPVVAMANGAVTHLAYFLYEDLPRGAVQ